MGDGLTLVVVLKVGFAEHRVYAYWQVKLNPRGEAARTLQGILEEAHGVEWVGMDRYSARVEFAPHVTDAATLLQCLRTYLEESPELKYQLRREFALRDDEEIAVRVTTDPKFLAD